MFNILVENYEQITETNAEYADSATQTKHSHPLHYINSIKDWSAHLTLKCLLHESELMQV